LLERHGAGIVIGRKEAYVGPFDRPISSTSTRNRILFALFAVLILLLTFNLSEALAKLGLNDDAGIDPGQFSVVPPIKMKPLLSAGIPRPHIDRYSELSVDWMQKYLQIDTTNPPGHEAKAAAFFKNIFDEAGIENRVFEYAPGRANIWAILHKQVRSEKRPIILLSHMDVVTSDPSRWKVPPFSGRIVDGAVYGRGAQDMKQEGLAQAIVMVMLKRENVPLDRDVIFLATADEEVDDTGTDWMIAHHREMLGNAEFLLTEGGENLMLDGRARYIGIDVAEKSPFWLKVTAKGMPGHGSRPEKDAAPNRLVMALNRILAYRPELKVVPVADQFLRAMAPFQPPERARLYRNMRIALQDRNTREVIANDESISYMLQDTIALTMLKGSKQTNVIPGEASANLDVRLLPGEDPKRFLETIRRVVNDAQVTVEPLKDTFSVANASSTNTVLWAAIRGVTAQYFDRAPVIPRLTSGYTENQRFRQLGIVCYGYSPYLATAEEGSTEHADNERVRIEELRRAPRVLFDVVTQISTGD
jgi:acetylornithine deacetylase/succinyl-diaminopimelate desuccinylase-like protein